MSKRQVQQVLLGLKKSWDTQGAGWVIEQDPPPGTPIVDGDRCALKFGPREEARVVNESQARL
jgi:hypothetical protein